jgi:hypothetical protein
VGRGHRRTPAETDRPGTGQRARRHADGRLLGKPPKMQRDVVHVPTTSAIDLTGMDLVDVAQKCCCCPLWPTNPSSSPSATAAWAA